MGVAVSLIISLLGAAVLAWLISWERMEETAMNAGCFAILAVAALIGGLFSSKAIGEKRMLICLITAAGFYIALLVLALVFGGRFAGLGRNALGVLTGGGIAILLGLVGNKSGANRHKFRQFR